MMLPTSQLTFDAASFNGPATPRDGSLAMFVRVFRAIATATLALTVVIAWADDPPPSTPATPPADQSPAASAPPDADSARKAAGLVPAKEWVRLAKDADVWLDWKHKRVIVGGQICLREGWLEMFACPRGTKEHESIVAVNSPARWVHGGLLACGAKPGPPVQFDPEYKPAGGTVIEVEVVWKDESGTEQRMKAQEWVKHVKTGKSLQYPWVFAGSGFWVDEAAGERFYLADAGEFICVSNFSTAMLDLPIESSDANDTLLFTAFTERIPPLGTPVFLYLTPGAQHPAPAADQDGSKSAPQHDAPREAASDATPTPPDAEEEKKATPAPEPPPVTPPDKKE